MTLKELLTELGIDIGDLDDQSMFVEAEAFDVRMSIKGVRFEHADNTIILELED